MTIVIAAGAWALLSCDNGGTDLLQSSCVHEYLTLDRTTPNGQSCFNLGYSDCERGSLGSECVDYCAFDICQAASCMVDEDCDDLGIEYDCRNYVVSDTDYGLWCGLSDCPRGTVGCPCYQGQCAVPDGWTVTCNAQNVCEGGDDCPAGCRAGSVCCGGTLCAGECVGTPCC